MIMLRQNEVNFGITDDHHQNNMLIKNILSNLHEHLKIYLFKFLKFDILLLISVIFFWIFLGV